MCIHFNIIDLQLLFSSGLFSLGTASKDFGADVAKRKSEALRLATVHNFFRAAITTLRLITKLKAPHVTNPLNIMSVSTE